MVKYLINWTITECVGGSETRYGLLYRAFPEAQPVSAISLVGYRDKRNVEAQRKAVDAFLIANTSPGDIVIKDAGVGGTQPVPCRKVLMFGNPYYSIMQTLRGSSGVACWRGLLRAQVQDSVGATLKIANSPFSSVDCLSSGSGEVDAIIPNAVDTDFFKPDPLVKRKGLLWVGSCSPVKQQERAIEIADWSGLPITLVRKRRQLSPAQMRRRYQAAAALIITSPVEGCCNAAFEAMACGIPVITTPSGWFWGRDPDEDREAWQLLSDRVELWDAGNAPRDYIINNRLTVGDYTKRMRETIACL